MRLYSNSMHINAAMKTLIRIVRGLKTIIKIAHQPDFYADAGKLATG